MYNEIQEAIERSKSTDLKLLIRAKEMAKNRVKEDPSATNLRALDYANKQLDERLKKESQEAAELPADSFKTVESVMDYIGACGRNISRAKIYRDINSTKLKKQNNGLFLKSDVDIYLKKLPSLKTTIDMAESTADRQRRKEEEEIRRIKAIADKAEFELAVKKGQYVPKESVNLELVARAIALQETIKNTFEAKCLDAIALVGGKQSQAEVLTALVGDILKNALNEYAMPMDFEVTFVSE